MTHTQNNQESSLNPSDDYTAKMDRMVQALGRRSKVEHSRQSKIMWYGLGVGTVLVALAVLVLLNSSSEGFSGLQKMLLSGR